MRHDERKAPTCHFTAERDNAARIVKLVVETVHRAARPKRGLRGLMEELWMLRSSERIVLFRQSFRCVDLSIRHGVVAGM